MCREPPSPPNAPNWPSESTASAGALRFLPSHDQLNLCPLLPLTSAPFHSAPFHTAPVSQRPFPIQCLSLTLSSLPARPMVCTGSQAYMHTLQSIFPHQGVILGLFQHHLYPKDLICVCSPSPGPGEMSSRHHSKGRQPGKASMFPGGRGGEAGGGG